MTSASPRTLGVGMVGYSFMGAAHSHAWRTAPRFFELPLEPRMAAICGPNSAGVQTAADRVGWSAVETDWWRLIARDDVDLIDVCTPSDSHAEISIAALEAGKHVLCEKPLALDVREAEMIAQAAQVASRDGVYSMVGFTYRRLPAILLARDLVREGRIGQVRHVRAQYLQDWIVDPEAPLSWRLQKERAGSGALGDIGAHIIDLTQYITGDRLDSVSGHLQTFVGERPLPSAHSGLSVSAGEGTGAVTVDDTAVFLARLSSGAVGVYETTRFATGRKNAIRIEINGSKGSIAFDFEDMNVLHFCDATVDPRRSGFTRILVTEPEHPFMEAWRPPGHVIGYEHGFTHQVVDLLSAIADDREPEPSFANGLQVQRVLDAVERSSAMQSWQSIWRLIAAH